MSASRDRNLSGSKPQSHVGGVSEPRRGPQGDGNRLIRTSVPPTWYTNGDHGVCDIQTRTTGPVIHKRGREGLYVGATNLVHKPGPRGRVSFRVLTEEKSDPEDRELRGLYENENCYK